MLALANFQKTFRLFQQLSRFSVKKNHLFKAHMCSWSVVNHHGYQNKKIVSSMRNCNIPLVCNGICSTKTLKLEHWRSIVTGTSVWSSIRDMRRSNQRKAAAITSREKAGEGKPLTTITLEVVSYSGVAIIVRSEVVKSDETNHLKRFLKNRGFNIGNAAHHFDHKGIVTVIPIEKEDISQDRYLEIGLEAGVEDVTIEKDENDKQVVQFICGVRELAAVRNKIEKQGLATSMMNEVYMPISPLTLEKERETEILDMFHQIYERFDYVYDISSNLACES